MHSQLPFDEKLGSSLVTTPTRGNKILETTSTPFLFRACLRSQA